VLIKKCSKTLEQEEKKGDKKNKLKLKWLRNFKLLSISLKSNTLNQNLSKLKKYKRPRRSPEKNKKRK